MKTGECKSNLRLDDELINRIMMIPLGYSGKRIIIYFWIGVGAALFLRSVPIIGQASFWGARAAWYGSIIAYCFFFLHRYRVASRRKEIVGKLGLLKKIQNREKLDIVDYKAVEYVLWSISVSKEMTNYRIIIIFSILALMAGAYFDFIKIS